MSPDLILYTKRIQDQGLTLEADLDPALLGLPSNDIVFVGTVFVRMRAQIVTKEILVQGTMDVSIQSDCARCLSKTTQELHLSELVFLYEYTGQDFIDLSPEVREELLLALPMRLLCSEDCKGLCPHCQKNWNKVACSCVQKNEKSHPFEKLKF